MKRSLRCLLLGVMVSVVLATGSLVLPWTALPANAQTTDVSAVTPPFCAPGYICLFRETNYTGDEIVVNTFGLNGKYVDLDDVCDKELVLNSCDWHTRSYVDASGGGRSWLNQYMTSDHGYSYCIWSDPTDVTHRADITSSPAVPDEWLLVNSNPDPC